ncbi:hypothetical protein BDQ12DRAFT_57080 [Crucibulum laeve]|uniref:Chromo domain-containing protein n=1 Tax=Crucibulum laeve TaxID=68775 RepID=A0A5C3M500_9AGAR|nr:hypothetical protein BDQ12DRAFT_57080 [Crucibulum laeve]
MRNMVFTQGYGKIGYFVKWKGYPDDENSWVNEVDAENAGDLVSEYWRNNPHKKKDRGKHTSAKRGRKSVTAAENSDGDSASVAKKRGRKSTKRLTDDEDKDDDIPPHKKAKNASASANDKKQLKKKKEHTPVPSEPDVEMIGDMSKYMDNENWEELVTSIDTIERNEDNTLTVYFTLNSGERVKEDSRICRQRLAQKLISFYENNLRWKTAEELADN